MTVTFNGADLTVRFKEQSTNGAELQYQIEYQCGSSTITHFIDAAQPQSTATDGMRVYKDTLTYAENLSAGLTRSPRVRMRTQAASGKWSGWQTIDAQNPIPVLPSAPVLTSTLTGFELRLQAPTDGDLDGYAVYVSKDADVPMNAQTERYRGKATAITVQLADDETYYVRVVPYDAFGLDPNSGWTPVAIKRGDLNTAVSATKSVTDLRADIAGLKDTYGSTENADAARQAAEAARDTARTHADNSKQASDQSAAARDAAQRILNDTTAQSGLADQAKKAAETARDAAQQSKSDASGFATTASGQATIAKQEADKSGASATLAKSDADRAATKAGEASTSAGKALTSEQNAEGSRNSAETFSKVAATTSAQTYPSDFSQGAKFWAPLQGDPATVELDMAGREFVTDPAEGPVMRITNPGIYRQTRPRALIPNIAGRRYRIEARVRVKTDGPLPVTFVIGGYGLQADFQTIVYGGHLEVNTYSYANDKVAADGWTNIWLEVTANGTTCPWLSPSVYVYSTNSTGQVAPGNCAVEYRYIKVSEVTESTKAGKSADASATSAANAKASETKAGQSAEAADGSKVAAQTAKGQAEAAQSKVATSESNAAGSASTAAAKEALTASTYRNTITATGNEQFNNGFDGWIDGATMVGVASSYGRSNVVRSGAGAAHTPIQGRKVPVTGDDQRFLLRASLRCAQAQSVYYVGAIFYDGNDNVVRASDGTGNYPLGSGFTLDSALHGWLDREVVIGKGVTEPSPYGGTRSIPAGAAYFRPCVYLNYTSIPNSVTEIDYYTVADVTSQQKAASSATAASVSASNAAASETVAGQKASAASGSADTANTKAGEASGSASRAALSEQNAEGSKNSASSSATLAAKSYIDTVRAGRNDDFEQGTDGWRDSPTEGNFASATWFGTRNIAGRTSGVGQRNRGAASLYADYIVPIIAGRSYRFETSFFVENGSGNCQVYVGFQCLGADGNYIGGNTGHVYWYANAVGAGAGWIDLQSNVWAASSTFPAGTTQIRPLILYNYLNNTNLGLGYVDYIRCLDVTESEKAAGSAAASTQQASTATTKATEAGQSAAAANSSRADAANLAADARREAKSASDQAAIATEKASAASSSQTLAATYASKLTAMNIDSEMERDVAVNDCWSSSPTVFSGVDARMTKTIAWDNVSCLFWPASINGTTIFSRAAIPVDTRRTYRVSCRIGAYLNGSSGGTNRFYIGFVGLNAAGQVVDHGAYGSFRYSALVGGVLTDGQISEFSANVTGEGNDSWVKFPPGTKQVRLCIIMNYDNGPTNSYVDFVRFEDVTESVTANASAQVAAAQAATATAQAAAAQKSAVLSASLSGGLIGVNTTFADYPDSHYSSAPPGWFVWSAGSALRRTYGNGSLSDPNPLSIEGSPWGINMVNPGTGDGSAGIYQEVRALGGKYVIEATAELGDGSWNGSGVLLYALDANKNWIGQAFVDFANEADINGTTAYNIANVYKVRRFSKPVTVPGGTNCAYIRVYAMTGWTGFTGSSHYKYMTWFKCGIRPASNAEAKVEVHEGAIAALNGKTVAYFTRTATVPGAEASFAAIATNEQGVATSNIALSAANIALYNNQDGSQKRAMYLAGGNATFDGMITARSGIRIGEGQWSIAVTPKDFQVSNGTGVSYGYDLGRVPTVTFGPCPISLNSGEVYRAYAANATSTGFTAVCEIVGSPVSSNQNSGAGSSTSGSQQFDVGKSTPDASNSQYTFTASGSIQAYAYYDGGGYNCVHIDAWVRDDLQAGDALAGDVIMILNEDGSYYEDTRIQRNFVTSANCVRLTSASGIQLTLSDTTPCTLRDMNAVNVREVLGKELAVLDENGFRWEEIINIEEIGEQPIAHISVNDGTYAAGDVKGRMIFTHNAINKQ